MTKTLLIICLCCNCVLGQQLIDPTTFDYSRADSIALNFPKFKYKSYAEIVRPLTDSLNTEHEKFRAIFRWITDNIQYNYGNKSDDPNKVVKRKKAVCIGYSSLLKEMANSIGIECEIISGYAKTDISDIPKSFKKTDHAWNAVKLYDKWYLLDVTWATSHFDEKKRKTTKSFNELYYLTEPTIFVKKHIPKDKKWQFIDKPITKGEFSKSFIYYSGYFNLNIQHLQPTKGKLTLKLKNELEIEFTTDTEIYSVTIELDNGKSIYKPELEKLDECYKVRQKFDQSGKHKITLFINGQCVATYKITIRD